MEKLLKHPHEITNEKPSVIIPPPLRRPKEITHLVRMEFAMDEADQKEKTTPCEKCEAICLKPDIPMKQDGNEVHAMLLCPLCFRKQMNVRGKNSVTK